MTGPALGKAAPSQGAAPDFRSGFACLVGRPNAGKSTLTNRLVGGHIAITSARPQTTRRVIRGVINRSDAQVVLVDTPGLHRPRTLLGQRLNDLVRATWADADAVVLCLAADEKTGPGDRLIIGELAALRRKPVLVAVTKADVADSAQIAERLAAAQDAAEAAGLRVAEFVPVSAVTGDNLELLADLIARQLPSGPKLYPDDAPVSDEPEEIMIAELVREAVLEGVSDELPHSVAVTVDEMRLREDRPPDRPLLDVHVSVHVERQSQKPIVIGRKGERIKEVGSRARVAIERLTGVPVFLDLHVRVAKDWQHDPKQLRRLGF